METIIKTIPYPKIPFKALMTLHGYNGMIPNKFIINKRIPGLGATSNEIESNRHSIIIAPFTAIIEVKKSIYKEKLFTIYGEYDTVTAGNDLLNYLRDESIPFKKIMTTPESFYKAKLALEEYDPKYIDTFFMLFDECDVIVADAMFRPKMLELLPDFFSFKNHAFISATPITPTDPQFTYNGFKELILEPDFKIDIPLSLIVTNNINSLCRSLLNLYSTTDSNPVFVFTNCKATIAYLAKLSNVKEDYRIFSAEGLKEGFFNDQELDNVFTSVSDQNYAKFNFLTSRFFSGVDIILEDGIKPHILMISNVKKTPHSIIHPNITALQIYGRCRKGITSITHLATVFDDQEHMSESIIETNIEKEIYHINELRKLGKTNLKSESRKLLKDIEEKNLGSVIYNMDGTINSYFRDNYLLDKLTTNIYTSKNTIEKQYNAVRFFNVISKVEYRPFSDDDINKLKKSRPKTKPIEILKQLHHLITEYGRYYIGNQQDEYQSHLNLLRSEDPLIFEAYFTLGPERIGQLRFNRKAIRYAIHDAKKADLKNNMIMIDEILISFQLYEPIFIDKIVKILDNIYMRFEYKDRNGKVKKAKGTDIELYFDNKPIHGKKKISGIYKTYYVLTKPKYKLSSDFKR